MTAATLAGLLAERAKNQPDRLAYGFLDDGERPGATLTYGRLGEEAAAIAAALLAAGPVGERALLLFPPGLDWVKAFWGAIAAGWVAVPAPLASPLRLGRGLERLASLSRDADIAAILTCGRFRDAARQLAEAAGCEIAVVAIDELGRFGPLPPAPLSEDGKGGEPIWRGFPPPTPFGFSCTVPGPGSPFEPGMQDKNPGGAGGGDPLPLEFPPFPSSERGAGGRGPNPVAPMLNGDSLVLLQYTSGSTAHPRAAMIRHRHLLHNLAQIDACQGNDADSVSLSWLPVFHDLGLIVGVLHPLYRGCPGWLMAPAAFLQRPLRWLEAIGLLRATNSGGPNFAFDLCVARTSPEQRAGLDLRSWRYAHVGGETVRAGTLSAFARAFAPAGFRGDALRPGYGLAEATLIVSAGRRGQRHRVERISRRALQAERRVAPPQAEADAAAVVGCGAPVDGVEVLIVDPATCTPCPPEGVGEIWVRGPSVAAGYWRSDEDGRRFFAARPSGAAPGEEPYLRTGDLGFLAGGELFVSGRLKDLIIVRGANHYPQDLELCLENGEPRLKAGGSAAFAVAGEAGEGVVLVAEVAPAFRDEARGAAGRELIAALREKIGLEHEVPVEAIVLLEPGKLLKTTSGKVRRQACREAFLEGELAELARWQRAEEKIFAESTLG